MTHDNPCTTMKSMTKIQRFQNKGVKGMKQNGSMMIGGQSSARSTQRCSPQMNQQVNQVNGSGVNSKRVSPNAGMSKEEGFHAAMPLEAGRGAVDRKSMSNQYSVEQSGANINQNGSRKYRNGSKVSFSPDSQHCYVPVSEYSNIVPYFPVNGCSMSVQLGSRRRSPPQPISSTFFAGSKFDVAPSPTILPPPPEHWINTDSYSEPVLELSKEERCVGLTSGLKILLKVQ